MDIHWGGNTKRAFQPQCLKPRRVTVQSLPAQTLCASASNEQMSDDVVISFWDAFENRPETLSSLQLIEYVTDRQKFWPSAGLFDAPDGSQVFTVPIKCMDSSGLIRPVYPRAIDITAEAYLTQPLKLQVAAEMGFVKPLLAVFDLTLFGVALPPKVSIEVAHTAVFQMHFKLRVRVMRYSGDEIIEVPTRGPEIQTYGMLHTLQDNFGEGWLLVGSVTGSQTLTLDKPGTLLLRDIAGISKLVYLMPELQYISIREVHTGKQIDISVPVIDGMVAAEEIFKALRAKGLPDLEACSLFLAKHGGFVKYGSPAKLPFKVLQSYMCNLLRTPLSQTGGARTRRRRSKSKRRASSRSKSKPRSRTKSKKRVGR